MRSLFDKIFEVFRMKTNFFGHIVKSDADSTDFITARDIDPYRVILLLKAVGSIRKCAETRSYTAGDCKHSSKHHDQANQQHSDLPEQNMLSRFRNLFLCGN